MVKKIILVASPSFTEGYAATVSEKRLQRLSEKEKKELDHLNALLRQKDTRNKNVYFAALSDLLLKADSYDLVFGRNEKVKLDYRIFQKTWEEADEYRASGRLIQTVKTITSPVRAIHGEYDPHPYQGVNEPLEILKDFKRFLLKDCGHYPWLEKNARGPFFDILHKEIG
jgi:pimeloyl-ACP methyl ester carboxylesterase